jgi:UDP-galactopyranose mutase
MVLILFILVAIAQDERKQMGRYLVVGAGFAGAVHARVLAEAGHDVDVIDRRSHIAGNAFDAVDDNGIRRHHYGPHLFHTSNMRVADWLSRFTAWVPYEHRVRARLPDGRTAPLPINRTTINTLYGLDLRNEADVSAHLAREAVPIAAPSNAAEYLYARIGRPLTDRFFRPYTRVMWALELEDLSPSVVKRIPLRTDDEDRYFPTDRFQNLPRDGYTALFECMLDHPAVRVTLDTPFDRSFERGFDHVFNSMAIDEYFGFGMGELPYRSIRFHVTTEPADAADPPAAQVNRTEIGPITRETWWHMLPGHVARTTGRRTRTAEEPCDYRDNGMERYYPVKTADNRYDALYRAYRQLAHAVPHVSFIGRCGTYRYLDMDQVVSESLASARRFLGQTEMVT